MIDLSAGVLDLLSFLVSFPKADQLGGVPLSLSSGEVLCSGSFWLTLSFACSFYELRAKFSGFSGILPLIRWSVA